MWVKVIELGKEKAECMFRFNGCTWDQIALQKHSIIDEIRWYCRGKILCEIRWNCKGAGLYFFPLTW